MNFRQCVIDCIAEGRVVQSFNRLHDRKVTPGLLSMLSGAGKDQLSLVELAEAEQELLACFILFVHRHVWRKMKFAEARVTRVREDRTCGISAARQAETESLAQEQFHTYEHCDAQLRPEFRTTIGQEAT